MPGAPASPLRFAQAARIADAAPVDHVDHSTQVGDIAQRRTPRVETGPRLDRRSWPVMTPREISALHREWRANPLPGFAWPADAVPRLRPGVRILAPLQATGEVPEVTMVAAEHAFGRLEFSAAHPWLRQILRHLGSSAAASFTVQDWLDEFELPPDHLLPALDMLVHRGVMERPDSLSPDTAAHPHP